MNFGLAVLKGVPVVLFDSVRFDAMTLSIQLNGYFLLPSQLTTWGSWKAEHPETLAMINDVGDGTRFSLGRQRSYRDFVIGLVLLALAIEVTRVVSSKEGVLTEVFAQGLTIAAWVSLWEAIANLFVEWYPLRKNIALYSRIANAPVIFRHFE